jgi:hypothetical protein
MSNFTKIRPVGAELFHEGVCTAGCTASLKFKHKIRIPHNTNDPHNQVT